MCRIDEPVDLKHGVTALQYALEAEGRYPPVLINRPRHDDGRISEIPVVTNLTASRKLIAGALGFPDHRNFAQTYAERSAQPIEPRVVIGEQAPAQKIVSTGDEADLTALPIVTQHTLDPGPYLTAAHATTYDPDTGTDNTAIQRSWVKGPRRMSWFPYPSSHNARNMRKFWARGEACPIAFWIGHHPLVLMGSQAKLRYPQSHWDAVGGILGEPMRLVPTVTHGDRIMVPADADIVIEGWIPPDLLEADGPFGEYTGFMGPQTIAPVCEVTAITRRSDAIYHDYGSGLADMLVPDNMAMEGKLFQLVSQVAPSLTNVHVPTSGRRFHTVLQFADAPPGEVRDGLMAAMSYRRVKLAIAVDDDIDIFNESQLLWALATRVQWSRDAIITDGLSTSTMDPSLPAGQRTGSKAGVDATLPAGRGDGSPPPVPPRSEVTEDSMIAARDIISRLESDAWAGE